MPYELTLQVYNSAGELVMTLFHGAAEYPPNGLQVSGSPSFIAGEGNVGFTFAGALEGLARNGNTILWPGENATGQYVSGGVYTTVLTQVDTYGHTTSYSTAVTVISTILEASLTVYNSAGEAVRHLSAAGLGSGAILNVPVTSKAIGWNAATGQPSGAFEIDLGGSGSGASWNGENDSGVLVAPGSYTIRLVCEQQGGLTTIQSKSVVLLETPLNGLGAPHAVPGLWTSGPLEIAFNPLPSGEQVRVRIYTVSGKLAEECWGQGPAGMVDVPSPQALASGVYLVDVAALKDSSLLERKRAKLAIVR
jgi:hypothetical protein